MGLRTLVLEPGQEAVIPKGATITAVIVDGDGQVSSSCDNLPEPVGYLCYYFNWEDDNSGSLQDAEFESLTVGNNTYMVPASFAGINHTDGDTLGVWINTAPEFAGIVKFGCEQHSSDHLLKISVPDGLGVPSLKIVNPFSSTSVNLYMYGILDEADPDCETCS